jgi:hypothetical protein
MSLTGRAVIALALMVGFHALALASARTIGGGAEQWRQICTQVGIADVELGTVRDRRHGR